MSIDVVHGLADAASLHLGSDAKVLLTTVSSSDDEKDVLDFADAASLHLGREPMLSCRTGEAGRLINSEDTLPLC